MDKNYNKFNNDRFSNESLKKENSYSNFRNEKKKVDLAYSYELGKEYEEELEECCTDKYKNDYSKKCNCREHKKTNKNKKY